MSYTPTDWKTGDVITAEKLNNMESGIVDATDVKYFDFDVVDGNLQTNVSVSEVASMYNAGYLCVARIREYDTGTPSQYIPTVIAVFNRYEPYNEGFPRVEIYEFSVAKYSEGAPVQMFLISTSIKPDLSGSKWVYTKNRNKVNISQE